MEKAKNIVTSLDRYPSTPNLYWNGIKNKQNLIGGIIGLIFIIITLTLIIIKGVNVFKRDQIILDSLIKKDISQIKINGTQIILTLLLYQNNTISYIPYRFLPAFGIIPIVLEVQLNYRDPDDSYINIQFIPMEPCGYQFMYCAPDFVFQPQCSYDSIDFDVCNYVKQYHIIFTNISSKAPILNNLYPMLLLFDHKYNLFEKNSKDIIKQVPIALNKLPGAAGMKLDKRFLFEVPVTKLQITDDESIMPSAVFTSINYTQTYYYPNDKLKLASDNQSFFGEIAPFLPTYFDFYISRSGFTETYKRSYYRIDSMLGEIFGLIGLLTLLFSFCCAGYNDWLMSRHMQESLNNTNLRNEKHFGIYLKQQVNKIKNLRKRDQTLLDPQPELKTQIDIVEMHNRMTKMEEELTYLKQEQNNLNKSIKSQ